MTRSFIEIDGATAKLAGIGREAPFAMALALTSIAKDVQRAEQGRIDSAFDQPTPFTQRSVSIVPATKAMPVAQVFIKDEQAEYLGYQERGGVRAPVSGAPVILPVQIGTNVYGNIPKGALRREKAKATTFVARKGDPETKHLAPGIYRRPRVSRKSKGVLKLLAAFEPTAHYKPIFRFVATAVKVARQVAQGRLREALGRTLVSGRGR